MYGKGGSDGREASTNLKTDGEAETGLARGRSSWVPGTRGWFTLLRLSRAQDGRTQGHRQQSRQARAGNVGWIRVCTRRHQALPRNYCGKYGGTEAVDLGWTGRAEVQMRLGCRRVKWVSSVSWTGRPLPFPVPRKPEARCLRKI